MTAPSLPLPGTSVLTRIGLRNPLGIRGVAVALLIATFVTGCSGITRPAPVRQTYLIDPPTPPAVAKPQAASLRVGTINVAAPFRGKAFVYRLDELRFDTDYYVEFLVPPATMLTEQTARALVSARPFERVSGQGSGSDADYVLDGFASALYADTREAGKPAAEIVITYYLTPTAGSAQTPIWQREYRRHAPMRDASPVAYAEALNGAFEEIVAELARDLAAVSLPARQALGERSRSEIVRAG